MEIIASQQEETENSLEDEWGRTGEAKKFRKLGLNARDGLEDWQRRNVLHATGEPEESEKEDRKTAKKMHAKIRFAQNYHRSSS